jgi:hypothetical protein
MDNVFIYNLEEFLPQYLSRYNETELIKTGSMIQIGSFETGIFEEITQIVKDSIIDDTANEENDKCPDWVKRNIFLGAFGEELVMNYLCTMNLAPEQVSLKSSRKGYDIKVRIDNEDVAYEVKTTTSTDMKFFISYTELKVAEAMRDYYNIFFINVNKNERSVTGYIINNPIKTLGIDLSELIKIYENISLEIIPSNFIVHIKEHVSEHLGNINMLKYLKNH